MLGSRHNNRVVGTIDKALGNDNRLQFITNEKTARWVLQVQDGLATCNHTTFKGSFTFRECTTL
jgi:hypothetical protein